MADPWLAERARDRRANILGWLAMGLGLVAWFGAGQQIFRVAYDARVEELYLSVAFGMLAAAGVGFCIRALRHDSSAVVAWTALLTNGGALATVGVRLWAALSGQLVTAP